MQRMVPEMNHASVSLRHHIVTFTENYWLPQYHTITQSVPVGDRYATVDVSWTQLADHKLNHLSDDIYVACRRRFEGPLSSSYSDSDNTVIMRRLHRPTVDSSAEPTCKRHVIQQLITITVLFDKTQHAYSHVLYIVLYEASVMIIFLSVPLL